MKQTVATLIAKTLDQAGVKRIWGVTGDSLNGLSDSLHRMGTIEWLGTRHEEVAAFAAGAEAQHRPAGGVRRLLRPRQPTLINGRSTATATMCRCWRSLHTFLPAKSAAATSETHPQEAVPRMQSLLRLVSNPEQLPRVLEIAMRKAILNRGVSVVVLPGDVALRMAPEDATLTAYPGAAAGAAADERAEQAGGNAEQGEEHHPDVRQRLRRRTMRWSSWPSCCRRRWCTRAARQRAYRMG